MRVVSALRRADFLCRWVVFMCNFVEFLQSLEVVFPYIFYS